MISNTVVPIERLRATTRSRTAGPGWYAAPPIAIQIDAIQKAVKRVPTMGIKMKAPANAPRIAPIVLIA